MTDKTIYQDAPTYCHYFFDLVQTNDLIKELEASKILTQNLFEHISPEKENYAYVPNKWTIKEVLRHIIDCEIIFSYRAFRFSRFDPTELAGFDGNEYIKNVNLKDQKLSDLLDDYHHVRKASIALYKAMNSTMLDFRGIANKMNYTPLSLGFMTVGHNIHHCDFIKTRYLNIQ